MKKIVIVVAAHKKYRMPKDSIYLPVQVGAEGKSGFGFMRDNSGENISAKNPNYCELTGLYWMWKNVDADYVGLVHYRRYFVAGKERNKWDRIANRKDFVKLLKTTDVILPHKRHYFIETNYSQYVHAHHAEDLDITREILVEKYPSYISAFDRCMRQTSGHKFNMFVMKKNIADAYCTWLFDILFELENRLDISEYSEKDARVFGYVAERLLDVWIETNEIPYKEMPVAFMEKQNWIKKGGNFLARKFGIKNDSQKIHKTGFSLDKLCELDDLQTDKLKKLLIEMLSDFIEMTEKYGLSYTLSGGSVLGAVRHHGFIPWDDDIDINMPRADYNKFINLFDEALGNKYILCTPEKTKDHGILCAQIRKKGTVYRSFNELSKKEEVCGICLDIFVIENTFNNSVLRGIHGCMALIMGYFTTCRKTFQDYKYLENYLDTDSPASKGFRKKAAIGSFIGWVSLDFITRQAAKCYAFCKNNNSKYVTIPSGRRHYFREMHLRSDLCESVDIQFENMSVKIPRGYDVYLKSLYGENYMQLPPVKERETHPLMEINLG